MYNLLLSTLCMLLQYVKFVQSTHRQHALASGQLGYVMELTWCWLFYKAAFRHLC